MRAAPAFWTRDDALARALALSLSPLAALYEVGQELRRATTTPARAPVPVVCVGNATLGGGGKTPFALLVLKTLSDLGVAAHFATRGYGGSLKGPSRVDATRHSAEDVGDEALLLAAAAPTFVSKDRAAGVAEAAKGAGAVVMDDGFQNPTQEKTLSFLLVRAEDLNARVFPAGPLRERVDAAMKRADVVVDILDGPKAGVAVDGGGKPTLRAWLEPASDVPKRAVAFCGIGRPQGFFDLLKRAGCDVVNAHVYADHYVYRDDQLQFMRDNAAGAGAPLVTTMKDYIRLSPKRRAGVTPIPVKMRCSDPKSLQVLLSSAIAEFQAAGAT
jgi:tetraacyldisaccharide 4'-kinase